METILLIINFVLMGLIIFREILHYRQLNEIVKDLTDKIKAKDLTEYSLLQASNKTPTTTNYNTEPIKKDIDEFLNAYYYAKSLERSLNEASKTLEESSEELTQKQ